MRWLELFLYAAWGVTSFSQPFSKLRFRAQKINRVPVSRQEERDSEAHGNHLAEVVDQVVSLDTRFDTVRAVAYGPQGSGLDSDSGDLGRQLLRHPLYIRLANWPRRNRSTVYVP